MLIPKPYQIQSITHDTADVFTLTLTSKEKEQRIPFRPGQFNMLYHFGFGEAAISICGDPLNQNELVHTIHAVGPLTQRMQELKAGEEIGVRGPFGSSWPLQSLDCDVLLIAGGLGIAALRSVLFELSTNRNSYQNITLLYGSKSPADILYQQDFLYWQKQKIKIETTVDHPDSSWKGAAGVVTSLISANIRDPKKTLVFICGPEIMIQHSLQELLKKEVVAESIFLSLERHMQCAVGFCGRCQYGPYFLCKDGPVFSYKQMAKWLMIKEL